MLKTLAFFTAVSMLCGFNPGALEREYTEIYEDQGFQNYDYHHTFSSGTFNSPESRLDGCKKYTTINDMILYDYPEIHENYDTLVVSSDIAPIYMDALKRRVDKNLSEYFLLCPLETAKHIDYENNTICDSGNYIMKAVWQEAPEIVVRSKDQSVPIDMDKLKEIIPEANLRSPIIQNNKDSYLFYITTSPTQNVTYASELDYLLTEDDIKTVINCRNDSLASVEFNGNWYSNMIYLPKNPDFSVDNIETVSEFFTSKNIGFTVTDYDDKYSKNMKTIVFDEEIPAAEYFELDFELGEKTGLTCGELCYYDDASSFANNSIEYFDIVSGDANNDGELSLADAVSILQSIGNPDEYRLTQQGKYNADVYNPGDGITTSDAIAIQQKLIGLTDTLSVY